MRESWGGEEISKRGGDLSLKLFFCYFSFSYKRKVDQLIQIKIKTIDNFFSSS